jgi:hypothetical protein
MEIQARLKILRAQIAECEISLAMASDPNVRNQLSQLAEHLNFLSAAIERAMADGMPITFLGRRTQEPFPMEAS